MTNKDPWRKREAQADLVILGDGEEHVKKVGGLLVGVKQSVAYPENLIYELVQKNGKSQFVAGCASLMKQLYPRDVGKFAKIEFDGWGTSKNGKFKMVTVFVVEPEDVTDEMKLWPRYGEDLSEVPKPIQEAEEEGDDLPF